MKIGKFATAYDLSHDTVRYYKQMGLLLVTKNGGHYEFTSRDCEDMEEIQQLKQLDFSLAEILQILAYKRVTGLKTNEEKKHYRAYFTKKQDALLLQERELKHKKASLSGIIKSIRTEGQDLHVSGFPLTWLPFLECPGCHTALRIDDGKIAEGMVMEAAISCNCGYVAMIEDGIYVDPKSIRPKSLFGRKPPTKEDYVQHTPSKFINFLSTGVHKIQEKLLSVITDSPVVIEAGGCVGFCLSQLVDTLPDGTVYILHDYDLDQVKKCKSGFEHDYPGVTFLHFACDLQRLPLANRCVDVVLDYCGTRHFGEQHELFLPELMKKYLKDKGTMIGSYHYFEPGSSGMKGVPENLKPYYKEMYLKEHLNRCGYDMVSEEVFGPVTEGGKYEELVNGNELYQLIYKCQC